MSGRRTRRGALHYLLLGINAGVFALVTAIAALVLIIPAATGSVALTVLTSSMEPGLPPGSLVVVKPTDPADVRIGSIITFQWQSGDPTLVTHRVIGVTADADGGYSFTTQGDNNDEPDPNPVSEEQLRGVVWYSLPLLGWVSNLMAGDLRPILVPVIGGALLLYAAVLVVQAVRGKDRGARAERSGTGLAARRSRGRRAAGAAPVTGPEDPSTPTTGPEEQASPTPSTGGQDGQAPTTDASASEQAPATALRPRRNRR